MTKKNKNKNRVPQVAALPIRTGIDGKTQVLVITSRDTGRWVIPKGWPMDELSDPKAALQEAFEEAGVEGDIIKKPIGTYDYLKTMDKGTDDIEVRVTVYLLNVQNELPRWPERKERIRDWVVPQIAAERVDEPELKAIISEISPVQRLAG
ncbi:MAG: NUDIX hydrolase [Pseudomonadota bacterium]